MFKLIDNNHQIVASGTRAKLIAIVERQRRFDPSYVLWLVDQNGNSKRVL